MTVTDGQTVGVYGGYLYLSHRDAVVVITCIS